MSFTVPRTVAMGEPTYFSVIGGANPHTRNLLGLRKRVDARRGRAQWHALAATLVAHGCEVCVIEAHRGLSGLVYPANAGFLAPAPEGGASAGGRIFYLSNLIDTRAAERPVYQEFLSRMGYATRAVGTRFEGEADFFPAGRRMVFCWGPIERQRFVPRLGLPPWRRVYGFRSDRSALKELAAAVAPRPVIELELCLEAHYHGDTVLCSFGPNREFLLAYMAGLTPPSRERLGEAYKDNLIALSESDGRLYAANALQTDFDGRLFLILPRGVSSALLGAVRERGVEPVTVDVSEFLAKGGGSVKCMVLDLGPRAEQPPAGTQFRAARSYTGLFRSRPSVG